MDFGYNADIWDSLVDSKLNGSQLYSVASIKRVDISVNSQPCRGQGISPNLLFSLLETETISLLSVRDNTVPVKGSYHLGKIGKILGSVTWLESLKTCQVRKFWSKNTLILEKSRCGRWGGADRSMLRMENLPNKMRSSSLLHPVGKDYRQPRVRIIGRFQL